MNIHTKKIDNIFKTRLSNKISAYDDNISLYVNDKHYDVKEKFELDKKSIIYEKKPIISYVSKIKNREENLDYLKFFMKKSKDINQKSTQSDESGCHFCFSNII